MCVREGEGLPRRGVGYKKNRLLNKETCVCVCVVYNSYISVCETAGEARSRWGLGFGDQMVTKDLGFGNGW